MLDLKNITAGYGKKTVINNVSFAFPEGKLLSLIGANGSGKSTLLKTAVGILPPLSGEITIDKSPASEMTRQEIARKIAYLPQSRSIPDMTVRQMVLHGRFPHLGYPRRYGEKDREIADRALMQTGLSDLADMPLSALSGGMRQNACIAMALAQDTDYIMLDEPTTFLDVSNGLEVMKILRELADGGKGVAAVMHDLPLAFKCSDAVAVLKNGGIAACGTPEQICASGIVRDIFGVGLRYCADGDYYHYTYD